MNEEEKQVTVEFLMNHLAVEDGNTQQVSVPDQFQFFCEHDCLQPQTEQREEQQWKR